MKALKPFGLFGNNNSASQAAPEDGRVVELFRSRAELRKQHDELGQEVQRLRDRLKQRDQTRQPGLFLRELPIVDAPASDARGEQ